MNVDGQPDPGQLLADAVAAAKAEGLTLTRAEMEPLDGAPHLAAAYVRSRLAAHRNGRGDLQPRYAVAQSAQAEFARWRRAAMQQLPVGDCRTVGCTGRLLAANRDWTPAMPEVQADGTILCDSRCDQCDAEYTDVHGLPVVGRRDVAS